MDKTIHTLIPDIYALISNKDGGFNVDIVSNLSASIAGKLHGALGQKTAPRAALRLSGMGARCPKALWHSVHTPELAEPLPPWAEIKYAYGHVLEALVISLAKAAGHRVEGEQDELVLDGIVGHRDCVIDGCVVDVKSSSSRSFGKFKEGLAQDDLFGYLDQLDGYVVASADDPLVTVKDKGYILAIDKQLGHMVLYEHKIREDSIRQRIRDYKAIARRDSPPACTCQTEPDGESGNIKLDVRASYSSFKQVCFPQLRTFLYANGPRFLTHVARLPRRKDGSYVPELQPTSPGSIH